MRKRLFVIGAILALQLVAAWRSDAAEAAETFSVWPDKPPGQPKERGPEKLVEGRPRPFYQITDVSKPTVSVFLPPKERRTGAAVLVCPGGGLQRLAIEHEGLEVADWLTSLNITVFVLKYRVPERASVALQDAQRALSLIRARAGEWGIDPDDIGVMGFSAGAEVAAWLSTYHKERQYEPIDASDAFSCRPASATLIYPGGLTQFGQQNSPFQIKEAIASHINSETPSMFVAQAFDDSSENSLAIVSALKKAKVPAELHIFQEGGHGFGVRETGVPADAWKERWIEWMQSQGFLDNAATRNYARTLAGAWQTNTHWPRFSAQLPDARLKDAYTAQRRLVRAALRQDHIAGFKGIALTENARKELEIDQPLSGTLLRSGQLKATDHLTIDLGNAKDIQLAPGLGYVISVDISFKILNDTQAQGAVSAIVPVVELPVDYLQHLGNSSAIDTVAANAGAGRYIVGSSKPLPGVDPTAIKINLRRDGQTIREMNPATDKAVSWHELRLLLNQITAQGYMLHAGDLILCSAPGKIQPAEAGKYQADFGDLGAIDFEIR